MKRRTLLLGSTFAIGIVIAQLVPGSWIFRSSEPEPILDENVGWACPMFCVVMDERPPDELCPVCGMELGPVSTSSSLDDHQRAMIGLAARRVEAVRLEKELTLYGEVDFDETRLGVVTARTAGWIEKLTRNVQWEEVTADDVLFELYAPELFEAQQELIAARDVPDLRAAARQRLALLGLDERELEDLASRTEPARTVPRRAGRAGVLVRRNVNEGAYVARGQEVFAIADLSQVWVQLEVFEPDLPWLGIGTEIVLRDSSIGRETFTGRVAFADPVVDRRTRTARVRVEVTNRRRDDGSWTLLPGQRLEARARIALDAEGRPLAAGSESEPVLALPRSSVLRTGKRAVVYVLRDESGADPFAVDPQSLPEAVSTILVEVEIGPLVRRAGTDTLEEYFPLRGVRSSRDPRAPESLREGMVVATEGAYLIDSQAQLAGSPSLLFPNGRAAEAPDSSEGR